MRFLLERGLYYKEVKTVKNNLNTFLKIKALKDKTADKPIVFKVKGEDGAECELVINRLSEKQVTEIVERIPKEAPVMELWDTLIYEAMPELSEKEALEAFECENNPMGVISCIFTPFERAEIGNALREVVSDVNIERIKN